jgi:hypothetical protein
MLNKLGDKLKNRTNNVPEQEYNIIIYLKQRLSTEQITYLQSIGIDLENMQTSTILKGIIT